MLTNTCVRIFTLCVCLSLVGSSGATLVYMLAWLSFSRTQLLWYYFREAFLCYLVNLAICSLWMWQYILAVFVNTCSFYIYIYTCICVCVCMRESLGFGAGVYACMYVLVWVCGYFLMFWYHTMHRNGTDMIETTAPTLHSTHRYLHWYHTMHRNGAGMIETTAPTLQNTHRYLHWYHTMHRNGAGMIETTAPTLHSTYRYLHWYHTIHRNSADIQVDFRHLCCTLSK